MKFLCTGDTQIGAHGRTDDQDTVLQRIADLAIDRNVDGVLHAGDVFHGPLVQPEELDIVHRFVRRLYVANIPLLVTLGNGQHDQAQRPVSALAIFAGMPGVTVVERPTVIPFAGVTVCCLPFVSLANLVAADGGKTSRDELIETAGRLLPRIIEELCAEPAFAGPRILLAHWHVDLAVSANGQPMSEILREPLLQVADLEASPLEAAVIGHNHRPQLLASNPADPDIPIFHVGSPMPLDFGEAAFDHGVWLLDVGDSTFAEFVPIESRPLVQIELDADDTIGPGVFDVAGAIVKVSLRLTEQQRRHADLSALRATLLEDGAHTVKIEVETVREDRARVESVTDELEPLEAWDAWVASSEAGDTVLLAAARERMVADLEQVGV